MWWLTVLVAMVSACTVLFVKKCWDDVRENARLQLVDFNCSNSTCKSEHESLLTLNIRAV